MQPSAPLDRLSDLIEAAAGVVGETDLEKVLRRLVNEARTATGARYAALGVIGEHGVLTDFLYEGISTEQAAQIGHLPTGKGVLGTVIRRNETIRLDHLSEHPDAWGFPPSHPPMSSFLGVPVAVGTEAFGNLYLTETEGGFTDQHVTMIEALSRIAGSAVQTARLHERLRRVAVIEDRQRIARELHDTVIQEMFAVGLGLQGLSQLVDDPQAEATLLDAVDRLDRSVETLRSYIFELRTADPRVRDLDKRLEELVDRMGSVYPTQIQLSLSLEANRDRSLDDEVVKIISEALSNALRHAAAEDVEVLVAIDDERCTIRVVDNGHGYDTEAQTGGMGLQNLRHRVNTFGGEMKVLSSEKGTGLHVVLPFS